MDTVDLVLKEDPVCWSVSSERIAELCSWCLKSRSEAPSNSLMRCKRCKTMHYCNQECQKNDWRDHKVECKRLEFLNSSADVDWLRKKCVGYPNDGLRLVSRLRERLRRETAEGMTSEGRSYHHLLSHSDQIQKIPESLQEFAEFCDLFEHFVSKDTSKCSDIVDKDCLLEIYGKVKVNSFGIKDQMLQSVGVGLYLSLCRLDHSCDPNARIVFSGKTAVVVPIRDKEFQSPIRMDRIRHSYIENLMPMEERRRMLKTNYFFDCQCHGCTNTKRNQAMTAWACTDYPDCSGRAIPTSDGESAVCQKCGTELYDTLTPKMTEDTCVHALEKLNLHFVELEKKMELSGKTASMIEGALHEHNLHRMRVLRWAYECCVQLNQFQDAVMYGEKVLKTQRFYLAKLDPWLACFGVNLAKVYMNCGQNERAKSLLEQFEPVFQHAFGKNSWAVAHLNELILKCE